MSIDPNRIPGLWTTDKTENGLSVELHPDGQLKRLAFLSDGKVIGPSLHIEPDSLAGELREVTRFEVAPDIEEDPQAQYEAWIDLSVRAITDRAQFVVRCSFCSKHSGEVFKIIQGPETGICTDCIGVCNNVLAMESGG